MFWGETTLPIFTAEHAEIKIDLVHEMDVGSVGGKLKRFAGDAATVFNRAVQVIIFLNNFCTRRSLIQSILDR